MRYLSPLVAPLLGSGHYSPGPLGSFKSVSPTYHWSTLFSSVDRLFAWKWWQWILFIGLDFSTDDFTK